MPPLFPQLEARCDVDLTAVSSVTLIQPSSKGELMVRGKLIPLVAAGVAAAAVLAGVGRADSTPVGPLPKGPTSTIQAQKGQLVAVALPHRANGRVWRVARRYNARVVQQVSEGDIGKSVVLVFRATGTGTTTIAFGLTRGETAKAFESRRFTVRVR